LQKKEVKTMESVKRKFDELETEDRVQNKSVKTEEVDVLPTVKEERNEFATEKVETGATGATSNIDEIDENNDKEEDENTDEGDAGVNESKYADSFGVDSMTVKEVKEALKKRQLSIKGTDKVLKKRLLERLLKEQDPDYTPKPKGRHCKWCNALMKKKNSFRGEFYGCSTWPACQYTTSMSGHADPKREHLEE
jgi:hypothetical protein